MWLEKLASGVLRVLTPLGPRYLQPSFAQRLYLLWVFRNFQTLPVKVLTSRQRRLVESMWAADQFVSFGAGVDDAPLLGTLEQRPPCRNPYHVGQALRSPIRSRPSLPKPDADKFVPPLCPVSRSPRNGFQCKTAGGRREIDFGRRLLRCS